MRTYTEEKTVYKFAELLEEAQDKAIEKLYDINVDFDWWEMDDIYNGWAEDIGLEVSMKEACFDLDRGSFLYFETYNHSRKENYEKGIRVVDGAKFLKSAGLNLRLKRVREAINEVSIDHQHYGGGHGKNTVDFWTGCQLTNEEQEKVEESLDDFIEKVLSALRKEYEYLTSREAIIETINANEYEFDAQGNID